MFHWTELFHFLGYEPCRIAQVHGLQDTIAYHRSTSVWQTVQMLQLSCQLSFLLQTCWWMERTICRDPVEMNCLCFVIVVITSGRYINNKVVKKHQKKPRTKNVQPFWPIGVLVVVVRSVNYKPFNQPPGCMHTLVLGEDGSFFNYRPCFLKLFFDRVIVLNLEPGNEVQSTESRGLSGTADYLNEIRLDLLGRMACGSWTWGLVVCWSSFCFQDQRWWIS